MTAQDFILKRLNRIVSLFSDIRFRYEVRSVNNHIIEVTPLSIYNDNEDYLKAEADFENEFEYLFPDDQILFVSEDSLTQIRNVQFEFCNNILGYKIGIIETTQLVNEQSYTESMSPDNYFALAA